MRRGDIYIASFPFGDVAAMKLRPVLLLTGPIGPVPEVLAAYISSVSPATLLPTDVLADPAQPEFQGTHLKVSSMIRLHKLATIHTRSLQRRLGQLSPETLAIVQQKLQGMLFA